MAIGIARNHRGSARPLDVAACWPGLSRSDILIGRDDDLAWLKTGSGLMRQQLVSQVPEKPICISIWPVEFMSIASGLAHLRGACRCTISQTTAVDHYLSCWPAIVNLSYGGDSKLDYRNELGATYRLHLNCWPRHEAAVQRILNIPDNRVRRLQPLRRQEVFELIKQMGILGPDWLQHLLMVRNRTGAFRASCCVSPNCARRKVSLESGAAKTDRSTETRSAICA